MIDNIDVDVDGMLWVGGYIEFFKFFVYVGDVFILVMFYVVCIDFNDLELEDVFIVFDGEINVFSVGVVYDGMLVVGFVFDDKVMVCLFDE